MIKFEHKVRVRYAEVDRMGFVYHGVYPMYWDDTRTEWLRTLGITYKECEEEGYIMPVNQIQINYLKPARYDDLLTISAHMKEKPGVRIRFDFETRNQMGELLNTGHVVLVYVRQETMRPVLIPEFLQKRLPEFFS